MNSTDSFSYLYPSTVANLTPIMSFLTNRYLLLPIALLPTLLQLSSEQSSSYQMACNLMPLVHPAVIPSSVTQADGETSQASRKPVLMLLLCFTRIREIRPGKEYVHTSLSNEPPFQSRGNILDRSVL